MYLGTETKAFVQWKREKHWKRFATSLFCFEAWPTSLRWLKMIAGGWRLSRTPPPATRSRGH